MPRGYDTVSTFNPQQQQGFQQLIQLLQGQLGQSQGLQGQGSDYISRLLSGSPEAFEQFEAPIQRQFREQTIPQLAEQFSGLGAGAQRSSAFQQALGSAGTDLSERLAALRGQLQLGALPQAFQYSQAPLSGLQNLLGLNTQAFLERRPNFGQSLFTNLAGGLGSALGSGLTGGLGSLGGILSKLFGGGR